MNKRLILAVLAGSLALAGCGPAAAKPAAPRSASADGRANIMVYSINSDGASFSAIFTGAVGDYGRAVTVDLDGRADSEHPSALELELSRGSFRLNIADIEKEIVEATSHEPIYPVTCSTFVDVTAAAPVVPGSGTGAYRGIN